jgi:hypothetical protein
MAVVTEPEGLKAAREYIDKLEKSGFTWDLLVGDAFVRGMRDIGYKNSSFAIAELVDNAIQAGATKVDIVFGFDGGAKPTKIAVIDNGHGMNPKMVRAALIWGAGTRADNRGGFGKYGYGLPSASVSQCHRVSVYSITPGGQWYRSYLDIDEIKDGHWTKGNRILMPEEQLDEPPEFVVSFLKEQDRWRGFQHGSVVVWEGIDRVEPKTREPLKSTLLTNLGVIYRNFLVATPMTVDGVNVEPCDPLFLTEGFRYYDLDDDRAIELPPAVVEVLKDKKTGEVRGRMRVRYARMPATFFRKPEFKHTNRPGKGGMNERLEIADANNGIIFCRNRRQIDVIRPPRNIRSINATTDRFWAVEVDFDASLDDLFSITTSKQQVRPDDSVWDMLKDKAKLFESIGEMFSTYKKDASKIAVEAEQAKAGKRASIEAIEGATQFRTTKAPEPTPARQQEADDNLDREARKRAARAGLNPEAVGEDLVAQRQGVDHDVDTEDMPGAPFFRCVQEGGTRMLYLNVAHPFYTELYAGPGATARLRAGLEVLLWTLGNAEVDADPESPRRAFYERERASVWSPELADALKVLKGVSVLESEEENGLAESDSAA